MASSTTSLDPLLVALKAVDPAKYPFYGDVVLEPAIPLRDALTDSTVAVGDDLLLRLHVKVGDSIKLGNSTFRIASVVTDEPDRLTGSFAAGPRILISQHALESTGLLAPGSRATRRLLFKLQPTASGQPASDAHVADLRTQLEAVLPQAQLSDYREANPSITRALDGATGLLSLMSLVALVLGAVGVAMAMRAHLQQRLDSIAIMKSLGAGSSQIIRIYLLQTLLLGLCGAVLGVVLGLGVQLTLPLFLAKLLHLTPGFRIDAHAALLGLGAGVLTTLLFTLPPLLDIRNVRPILILRRAVENEESPLFTRAARHSAGLGSATRGDSANSRRTRCARRHGCGLATGRRFLRHGASSCAARAAWRRSADASFAEGVSEHHTPPASVRVAAWSRESLPAGQSFRGACWLRLDSASCRSPRFRWCSGRSWARCRRRLRPNCRTCFSSTSLRDEVAGVRSLLATQPTVQGTPEIAPVISARITAVNDTPFQQLHLKHMPRRGVLSVQLTWPPTADAPPPGDKVVSGKWWSAATGRLMPSHPLVAIERHEAERLNVHVGDRITFMPQDEPITATVAALYEADSQHAFSRAEFVLPESALRGLPVTWYGGLHCDPSATGQLRRILYQHYPTITVIDVAATVETVRQVLLQISYVIQFLAGFSTFAGIVILASAIAGTRYRRIREVVVLKTLGATRPRIASIFSIEFAVLGLIAAVVGLVFANGAGTHFAEASLSLRLPLEHWVEPCRGVCDSGTDGCGGLAREPSRARPKAA